MQFDEIALIRIPNALDILEFFWQHEKELRELCVVETAVFDQSYFRH